MRHKNKLQLYFAYAMVMTLFASVVASCASIGTPSGGQRDYNPPVYKKSTPANNQTGVKSSKIEIEFDEIITLDNPGEKVIISPPQREMPKIKATGKKIYIELLDSLLSNTTYVIDFGDAIKDNNEGNILSGFSLAFSTGKDIDSLQISGTVLYAENLEPATGMTVGVHTDLNDSAFKSVPLRRISRSDAYGKFTIRNLSHGKYRLFGLKDSDRTYTFNNPSEDIAFYDFIIEPSAENIITIDTTYTDSITIDTIKEIRSTRFIPDTLILMAFNEGHKARYLSKTDRIERRKVGITFSSSDKSLLKLMPLNFTLSDNEWSILERSIGNDTLTYWIKDSLVYKLDTLTLSATYNITDSLLNLVPHNDTLTFTFREKINQDKRRRTSKEESDSTTATLMTVSSQIGSPSDIYASPAFTFDQPIANVNSDALKLQEKRDSGWIDIKDFSFIADTLSPRKYYLKHKWGFAKEYKFTIDSLGITSIYGNHTGKIEEKITIRKSEDYSNLYIETKGIEKGAFVELLDKSDKAVRHATVRNGGAEFAYVRPGTYYARLIVDTDNNRRFTTGNYLDAKQPEKVYYYPKSIELKPNWDVEQTWDIFSTELDKQKPKALIKNKPTDKKERDKETDNKETDPIYSNRPTTKLKY